MKAPAMQALESIPAWWRGRSERERRFVRAWLPVVVVMAGWFGVLSPLFKRIAALERRVPEMELQLNRMRAHPVDASRANRAGGPANEDLRGALHGQLSERQISAELRALSATRVELRLPELPVKEALVVLDALRQETGARVAVFAARNDETPGHATRIVVELERAP
jgi:type II secretory pathway component PulM